MSLDKQLRKIVKERGDKIFINWALVRREGSNAYRTLVDYLKEKGELSYDPRGNFSLSACGVVGINPAIGCRILYFTNKDMAQNYAKGFYKDAMFSVSILQNN